MKNKTFLIAIMGIMTLTILTNCGDASKKKIKGQKEVTIKKDIKTAAKTDWEKFKLESESVIKNIEKEIETLSSKISEASKDEREMFIAHLDKLKQKNKELMDKLSDRSSKFKENLIEFNDSAKAVEKKFESEFNHDTNELKMAIKDFFKDNVD